MTRFDLWSRRRLLGMSLATAGLPHLGARAQNADRGLGGTGAAPPDTEGGDRGIGGTGVVGTIRGFGSILVNGLRVTFPRSVEVRIDDHPAHLRDLTIGHVVHVLARRHGSRLATRRIDAVSEVSGPIEALTPDGFSVLGQNVIVPDAKLRRHRHAHHWVAVSGLRRLDGTIVASLITPRPPGTARVSGLPQRGPDATVRVGALAIQGLPGELVGQRLHISGRISGDRLVVTQARPQWLDLLSDGPDRLSVEDYVALDANGARFASGLPSDLNTSAAGFTDETRAVVSATVAPDGRVTVEHVQPEGGRGLGAGSSRSRAGPGPGDPQAGPPGQQNFGAGPGPGPNPGGPRGGPGPDGGRPGGPAGPGGGGNGGDGPGRGGGSRR